MRMSNYQNGTTFRRTTRKTNNGYVGYWTCYERGRRLWSKSTGIVRLNRTDAYLDACNAVALHIELSVNWQRPIEIERVI